MFKKAVKTGQKVRLAIAGPSGSGKTFSALRIASGLGKKIAVLDTERGSSSKYAGDFDFDIDVMSEPYSVEKYRKALRDAAEAGYDVIVMDSISHAWAGTGGVRDVVDKAGGKFDGWRAGNRLQNAFIDEIMAAPIHVIATMRSKMDYSVEKDDNGKTTIRKLGLAPVQRDGVEYEFDLLLEMDESNTGVLKKSRCKELTGRAFSPPDESLGKALAAWLSDAAPDVTPPPAQAETQRVNETSAKGGLTMDSVAVAFSKFGLDVDEARYVLRDRSIDEARVLYTKLCNMPPAELKAEVERMLA